MSNGWQRYKFDRSTLDPARRKPGISGMLRVRGREEFLDVAIRSHFPYLDEIVAVYQECPPEEEAILKSWATRHPERFRLFRYEPPVHRALTVEHANTAADSVHGLANYYNWTLSKTRYRIATKVDADHIVMPREYGRVVAHIRRHGLESNVILFSGPNVAALADGTLGFYRPQPYVGVGDMWFLPVNMKTIFEHDQRCERLYIDKLSYRMRWVGFLFYHLKYMKEAHVPASETVQYLDHLAETIRQDYLRRRWGGLKGVMVKFVIPLSWLHYRMMTIIAPWALVSLPRCSVINHCDAKMRQQHEGFAWTLEQLLSI